jgi:ParB family chromosome partitioning protein
MSAKKILDKKYEQISASKKLKRKKIPVIYFETDYQSALMVSANLQKENLNPIDEVCAVIQLIIINFGMTGTEVKLFLTRMSNFEMGRIKEFSIEEKNKRDAIIELLEKTGKFNLFTLLGKMRVLNINPLLSEAVKDNHMPYTVALALNKLKDENQLKKMIKGYFINHPTLKYVKDKVRDLLGEANQPNPLEKFSINSKKFKKLPPKKQAEIKQKISEIESLLAG